MGKSTVFNPLEQIVGMNGKRVISKSTKRKKLAVNKISYHHFSCFNLANVISFWSVWKFCLTKVLEMSILNPKNFTLNITLISPTSKAHTGNSVGRPQSTLSCNKQTAGTPGGLSGVEIFVYSCSHCFRRHTRVQWKIHKQKIFLHLLITRNRIWSAVDTLTNETEAEIFRWPTLISCMLHRRRLCGISANIGSIVCLGTKKRSFQKPITAKTQKLQMDFEEKLSF